MISTYSTVGVLGLCHGINDCIAGFLLGSMLLLQFPNEEILLAILMYNLLAFGGQIPFGILADRINYPRFFVLISLMLGALSLLLFPTHPRLGIITSGLASAIFHVSGGVIVLGFKDGRVDLAGLFTGPGVAGLIIGGYLAAENIEITTYLLALLLLAVLLLTYFFYFDASKNTPFKKEKEPPSLEQHDLIMIALLFVIAMRSVIWNIFQYIFDKDYQSLLWIGLAAFLGKIIGGFISQKIGLKTFTFSTFLLALPMLYLGHNQLWLTCLGIGLVQSNTPVALLIMYRFIPHRPSLSVGLSLGFAILLGGIFYTSFHNFINHMNLVITLIIIGLCMIYFGIFNKIGAYLKES